jgi:hypothetical protein
MKADGGWKMCIESDGFSQKRVTYTIRTITIGGKALLRYMLTINDSNTRFWTLASTVVL